MILETLTQHALNKRFHNVQRAPSKRILNFTPKPQINCYRSRNEVDLVAAQLIKVHVFNLELMQEQVVLVRKSLLGAESNPLTE